jgi:D-alanyl-lipoteichoic acid acyltransferase DltB (MBOAT superfamily)
VWLLAGSIVVNWAFGHGVRGSLDADGGRTAASANLVRAAVVVNLGFLGFFKYYGFFVDSFRDALEHLGLGVSPPLLHVALPVGISFFTFHALSYVIDIGRGQLQPMQLDELALYMSFFPHLVAGPIVRASEFQPQLHRRADPRRIPSGEAFRLIAFGLFKKVVISSFLATELVDPVFGAPAAHSRLELLTGVYGYAIQIYADFSGYTDIAIGCALLLGIRFPQNFDAPYRALSLQDFWRRWHMTLSRWLRDYLYIPLGGSRDGVRRLYRNLFLTMVIGGLWHGAAITFVVWGAIHGGFLGLERFARERWRASRPEPVLLPEVSAVLRWVVTFHVVCLGWVFFRADSVGTALDVLHGIVASPGPAPLVTVLVLVTIGLALASQFVPPNAVAGAQNRFAALPPGAQIALVAGALTAIDVLGPDGVAPFIYFQF